MGKSLIGQLLLRASKRSVYLWSNSQFVELVSEPWLGERYCGRA
jgi:hypothetical protein